jgi:hypothetical protein
MPEIDIINPDWKSWGENPPPEGMLIVLAHFYEWKPGKRIWHVENGEVRFDPVMNAVTINLRAFAPESKWFAFSLPTP